MLYGLSFYQKLAGGKKIIAKLWLIVIRDRQPITKKTRNFISLKLFYLSGFSVEVKKGVMLY